MLAKIYDSLTILLILCGIVAIGFIYYNRDWFFKHTVSKQQSVEHSNLVPAKLQIESGWLKQSSSIRSKQVFIPQNTSATVFVSGLNKPTNIISISDKKVVVVEEKTGNLVVLEDKDNNNSADNKRIFISGLNDPYGIDYLEGDLYVGLESDVIVFKDFLNQLSNNTNDFEYVVRGIPSTHLKGLPIKIYAGKLYIGVSASCNYCIENDKRRGSVVSYNLDGSGEQIYASGFKQINSLNEVVGLLSLTESSVDQKGVSDEFNIVKKDGFYGWPYVVNQSQVPNGSNLSLPVGVDVFSPTILFSQNAEPFGFLFSKNMFNIDNSLFFVFNGENKVVYYTYPNFQEEQDVFLFSDYTPKFMGIEQFRKGLLISDYASGVLYYLY